MKECKNCNIQYEDSSMFCTNCGGQLTAVVEKATFCPTCGTKQTEGAVFCPNCGTRQAAAAVEENKCPTCGRHAEKDVVFCPDCGTKIQGAQQVPAFAQPQAPQAPAYQAPQAPAYQAPQAPAYQAPQAPVYQAPQAPQPVRPNVVLTEDADHIEQVPEEFRGKLKKAQSKHKRQRALSGVNGVINTLYSIFWIIFYGLWAAIGCVFSGIAYCCALLTIPCGIVQFKSIGLVFSPFKKRVVTHFGSKGFWNVVWLIFGGFFLFLGTKLSQLLFNITFIGRRLGEQLGKLATFYLAPFGAQILHEDEFSSEEVEKDVYTRQYIYRNQFNPQFAQVAESLKAATKEENKKRLVKNIVFAAIVLPIIFLGFISRGMMLILSIFFAVIIVFKALDIVFDFLTSWHMDKYGYGHRKALVNRYDQKSRFQKMSPERKVCRQVYPSIAPYVDALVFDERN